MKRRMLLSLLAVASFPLLAGCKPAENAAPGGSSPAPAAGGTAGKLRVVFIPKNTGNPYFDGVAQGIERACKEVGAEFSSTGPAQAEPTSQIPFLKDEVQRGANVVLLAANSPDALNATLDEIRGKGVTVVTVDSDIAGNESHRDAGVLPVDFDKLGEAQIELMGSLIGYEGKFAILSATTDAPNQNHWIAGMKEALKLPKYQKMQLADIVYGDDKDQKSVTEAEGLLTKYPDLRGILAPTTVGVAAAAKAVETAGAYPGGPNAKGKGVAVTGLGTPNQMRRYLKDGIVPAAALWSPPDMGYLAAQVALAIRQGKLKPEAGASLDVPGMGKRPVGKNGVVITGPPVVFKKDNVDQYQF